MKTLSAALTAHLATGATSLCWCWRIMRADGLTLGFTDHDRPLTFDGTVFEADAGFTASEIRESIGLSVDNLDVEGAVTSERLADVDLEAGLYDDARVEIYRVNWEDVGQRVLVRAGSIGEVRRSDGAFVAEIRGLAHYLQQPGGRLYQFACDADLGDSRCGVSLAASAFSANAVVAEALSQHEVRVTGLETFEDRWFERGFLTFTSGDNGGRGFEIKRHTSSVGGALLVSWHAFPELPASGDALEVRAGCDKSIVTCRGKFANAVNFRGFPHMPGNDFLSTLKSGP